MTADPTARGPRPTRTCPPAPTAAPPWILMYHSVADPRDDPYGITVAADRLDHHLRWLRRRGLTGVGVGALLRARAAGRDRGLVGLTFDDGYADFLDAALPALRRHGCTATVFVLPGRPGGTNEWDPLGPRRPLLTESGIREAAEAGMEIGSHGLVHRDLTRATDEELRLETRSSRALIRRVTGEPPQGFCYPYGTFDQRVADAVRDAGYTYGCAIDPGPLTGPYALPRTHISQADRAAHLWAKRLRPRRGSLTPPERAAAPRPLPVGGGR
ncbi:polysaccharide deacetylase family protein [Streptomyces candidus]|uniref:Peptidoglycan/xylan/chitin deacetylase (PgdA/CDA1 family) n=1 Tax=Streptomyces candidus TaxID=67283 RepID=A0A7X0HJ75_9ACTN|nr:peptidoglycan/xylan/chitin deacetylase (PgdA/CDA1 family) [Streptomyces candidus]GHH45166.1 polysaccharide deacetylase [Streptomyces candidus]